MKAIALFLVALGLSPAALADDKAAAPAADAAPAAEAKTTEPAAVAPEKSEKPEKQFTGEAAAVKSRMEELFAASRKVNGPEKTSARSQIESALDWEKIAHECLGEKQWKKLSAQNRNEFKNLLKDVVVKTAYSRLDKFWDNTKYRFDKIDVKGGDAHVKAKFTVNGDSFGLDYFFMKKGPQWLIKDVAFEDIRYSQNINEQLTAFLRDKTFAELLQNLRKRRDELEAPKKS